MSASLPFFVFHTMQRCHSVFSCFSPEALFHVRLVASEKLATRPPPVVERTSGSLPRFPMSMTLFRLRLTVPPGESLVLAQNSKGAFQATSKPIISAVSKSARRFLLLAIRHLERPPQHQRVLDRPPIVRAPPSDFREAARRVQRPGSLVRFPNLEKRAPHAARRQLDQHRVQHLSRQTPAAKRRSDRDVEYLAVLSDREPGHVPGNLSFRATFSHQKDSWFHPNEPSERLLGPRVGEGRPLDAGDLRQITFHGRPEECGHRATDRRFSASRRTCASGSLP